MATLNFFFIYIFSIMTIVTSINTRGLRCQDRRKNAFTLFQRNRMDMILLQETHWTVNMEMEIRQQWGGEIIFNHGTNSARGVAILFNPRLSQRTSPSNIQCNSILVM